MKTIHLCLGLITGTIVFLIALSGALYCFAPEFETLTQPYRKTTADSGLALPPSVILKYCVERIPDRKPGRIYYHETGKAIEVVYYHEKRADRALFLNPVDGSILKDKNLGIDPVQQLFYFHRTLFLPNGELITGSATLLFLFLIISGIWLWWPRNNAAKKQRFRIKWTASPRRLCYDLHSTVGFYSSWIGILFVITGLNFSFPWFARLVYSVTGAAGSVIAEKAPTGSNDHLLSGKTSGFHAAIDKVWQNAQQNRSAYKRFILVVPPDSNGPILLRGNPDLHQIYRSDFRYFNQATGEEIEGDYIWGNYKNAAVPADYVRRMNYDIHTGAILGLPGRIIAFFSSLLISSLPITGFLLWKRRKKQVIQTFHP
ncbi:PepSY-associated TM helix domain-containing protein [Flavihumibacter sp. UBA7668]|uniref:PepSY-associated TM helix domain-containing protein n=1 Tax=Flavihumibacter sp. UBA7668 TaxID=1946542 RepID=UPI0025BE187E|nr:PepSY-associated TM helix domain-containing protein [Flavihumibacter sp. UBA7668]